ncbi:hypothetical protein EDB86DRAFT_1456900 [Lactarius hatsudake]|nr:hypothetical protein EDB86DRAFT_1456900 [Lactarius hatsudake]
MVLSPFLYTGQTRRLPQTTVHFSTTPVQHGHASATRSKKWSVFHPRLFHVFFERYWLFPGDVVPVAPKSEEPSASTLAFHGYPTLRQCAVTPAVAREAVAAASVTRSPPLNGQAWFLRQWLRPCNEWKSHETARVWPHVPNEQSHAVGSLPHGSSFWYCCAFPCLNGTKQNSPVRFGVCVSKRGCFHRAHPFSGSQPKKRNDIMYKGANRCSAFRVRASVRHQRGVDARHLIWL